MWSSVQTIGGAMMERLLDASFAIAACIEKCSGRSGRMLASAIGVASATSDATRNCLPSARMVASAGTSVSVVPVESSVAVSAIGAPHPVDENGASPNTAVLLDGSVAASNGDV